MKKNIFLFGLLLLLSCSSNDSSDNSNSDFNPPSWIQGSWQQEDDGVTFSFTSNDICFTGISGGGQCQQQLINISRQGGLTVDVEETITNSFYSAEINYSNGQSTTYAFDKISNTVIEWTGAPGVELIKQ